MVQLAEKDPISPFKRTAAPGIPAAEPAHRILVAEPDATFACCMPMFAGPDCVDAAEDGAAAWQISTAAATIC
jgi:hypothetical protein